MTVAFSTNLGLYNITTGTESGLWGNYTNTNICTLIEQAISGYTTQAIADVDTTISITNGASSTGRNAAIKLTGALTQARSLIVPTVQKLYYINNATTGGFGVIVKTSAQVTGITVPNGKSMILLVDGTNVVEAVTYFSGFPISANPSGTIGLTAVNGTNTTFMTSDSAPALSQNIAPTWTAAHIWSAATTFNGTSIFGGSATFNAAFSATSTAGFSGTVTFTSTTNPTMNDSAGNQFAVGFRAIPQNATTTSAPTLGLADSGKHIYYTGSTTITQTIPANSSVAYPVGTVLTFINDASAAVSIQIAITTDTLVWASGGTTGTRTLARYGIATATKVTSTRWIISGTGLS